MSISRFDAVFRAATATEADPEGNAPYDYQRRLPAVNLAGVRLSIDCRRMGRDANGHESYTRGVLRLLEHYGPFRLAFFEAVFRAADVRASIKATTPTA